VIPTPAPPSPHRATSPPRLFLNRPYTLLFPGGRSEPILYRHASCAANTSA
jgi:hypothetical protein